MKSYLDSKDIFESQAEVLVNPVNCKGVMGKGLALQFKNKFPQIYETYYRDCGKGALKAGFCYFYHHYNGIVIACLTTKDDWRDMSKLEWVKGGIRQLRALMEDGHFSSVAIPQVGCGLGGLDWNRVRPMIIEELKGCKFDVWLDGEVFERNREGINMMGTEKLMPTIDTQKTIVCCRYCNKPLPVGEVAVKTNGKAKGIALCQNCLQEALSLLADKRAKDKIRNEYEEAMRNTYGNNPYLRQNGTAPKSMGVGNER